MGSNTHQNFQQPNSALLRFRSAPSSLFSDFAQGIDPKRLNLFDSSDSERLVSRFGNRVGEGGGNGNGSESPVAGNYSSGLPPHYPRLNSAVNCSSSSSSTSMSSSIGFLGSNLSRQNSSPAGVFSQLIQNGLLVGNNEKQLANTNGEAQFFNPFASWNESSQYSEAVKRDPDSKRKFFSSSHQNGEIGNRVHLLSHHLSLPKNTSDINSIEKLLHLQDAVPCRIRAKRGCATHPRSIAERVRRTRISERMRKLQELVPNMDKQTNTADMLDLAVDYIKELQKQFKTLSDNRANCVCLNMQKPVSSQIM